MLATLPPLSSAEETLWCELIQQRCGLVLSASRLPLLHQALRKRLRYRRLTSFTSYYEQLAGPQRGDEWNELLSLLLNHESSFFHHWPSFAALARDVLPLLRQAKAARGESCLRVWSAGCSRGQEVYSLVMTLLDTPMAKGLNLQAVGTDLNWRALARARDACYRQYEMEEVPEPYRSRYFQRHPRPGPLCCQVSEEVRQRVEFRLHNLKDPNHGLPPQDVIFCQNVLPHLQASDRPAIVTRLADTLAPGGCLFLLPAEVVGLKVPGLEPLNLPEVAVYRRPLR